MVEVSSDKQHSTRLEASFPAIDTTIQPASGPVIPARSGVAGDNTGGPSGSSVSGDDHPSSETGDTPADPRPMPKPYIEADKQPVVLIVEDTTELAEVIQATLERMGMQASYETHGSRALAKLETIDPDVVLLDISLPDMTGWKILEAIKARAEKVQRMPVVIIITAHDDPANRLVGKLQDVYSYLVKPFTSDAIERIVSEAIDRARR